MSVDQAAAGPRVTTLLRLAVTGGRADLMRIVLTVVGSAAATVVLLTAATVASVGPSDGPYGLEVLNEPGLRPGVMVVLLLLCVPILSFVGQCVRVGAPARDRRLAAFRMAGGTPGDARAIVALETGLAAAAGAVVGAVVYAVLHATLRDPPAFPHPRSEVAFVVNVPGAPNLPTDVLPPWWLFVLACAAVPLGATAASLVALRRITIGPFGVLHRVTHRPPALLPAVVFAIGAGGLILWSSIAQALGLTGEGIGVSGGVALLLFVMAVVGLVFGSAAVAYQIGSWLAPRTGNPALLIASRRMVDAPFTASRASSVVVLAVMLGSAVQGTRANFLTITDPGEPFYRDTFTLLDVGLAVGLGVAVAGLLVIAAEGVIARRRTLASLAASGTPRHVLAGAIMLETVVPLVPAVLVASAAGLFAARGFFGTSGSVQVGIGRHNVSQQVSVPVPWTELLTLVGGTLGAVCLVTAGALVFLRSSTKASELRASA
ncbi:MAG: FtsX-like permease family protein [Nocardioidaceae bacterium]